MEPSQEIVTILWRNRATGERSRLSLSRRAALWFGGVCLTAALGSAVAVGVTLRLHQENAELHARARAGEELTERLAEAEAEMAEAWEGLVQVRAEEAKIRQWLGLDDETAAALEPADVDPEAGGRGSLGDVDLETVAPEDLATAVDAPELLEEGLGLAARSLATDLANLASRIQERKRYWDAIPTVTPVDGEHWVSSAFGWRRSPFTGEREFHSGVDIAGARGTPVVAAAEGRVARVVKDKSLGRAVTLDHGNGFETVYGHLDRVLVKEGQRVGRGQEVGKMGSTGRRSTGPHVHYAVRENGKYVNPKNYLLDRSLFPYPVAGR